MYSASRSDRSFAAGLVFGKSTERQSVAVVAANDDDVSVVSLDIEIG